MKLPKSAEKGEKSRSGSKLSVVDKPDRNKSGGASPKGRRMSRMEKPSAELLTKSEWRFFLFGSRLRAVSYFFFFESRRLRARSLAVYMGRDLDWIGLDGGAPKYIRSFALTRKNLHLDLHDYQINYVNIDLRHQQGISVVEVQTCLPRNVPSGEGDQGETAVFTIIWGGGGGIDVEHKFWSILIYDN